MNNKGEPEDRQSTCPICGARAERGCLYASDRTRMHWIAGPASFGKNFTAGWGGGEPVGHSELLSGVYARGISCPACRRIVLEHEKPA
jgi:hypothetical protein